MGSIKAKVVVYNVAETLQGGGGVFLQHLLRALELNGYKTILLGNFRSIESSTRELKDSDIILCYGPIKYDLMYKIRLLSRVHRKPILWILGGTVLVRKPDRPLYMLQNIEMISKLLLVKSRFPEINIAVHNRDDYSLLKSIIGSRVYYMPPAVDCKLFRPLPRDDTFTIVCNASPASYVKGTDFLLKIIPRIVYKLKGVRIVVLTGGAGLIYFRNVLKVYERLFPDRICVVDQWISHEEIASILGRSHLLAFPSRFEGFGILIVEAQSCGVPVIAFDIPGASRDVIIDSLTGKRVKPYNLRGFVNAIISYYELWKHDPSYYAKVQEKCRERAKIFNIEHIGKYWEKIISFLIKTSSQKLS